MAGAFGRSDGCRRSCTDDGSSCEGARRLLELPEVQAAFARTALSGSLDMTALARTWPDVVDLVRARRHPSDDEQALLRSIAIHGAEWLVERRGAEAGWQYSDVAAVVDDLQAALLANLAGQPADDRAIAFRRRLTELETRTYDPFPGCAEICPDGTSRFRWAAADLVASGRFEAPWTLAMSAADWIDPAWSVAQDAGAELIEWFDGGAPDPDRVAAARRASLCFAQQMIVRGTRRGEDVRTDVQLLVDRS